MDTFNIDEIKQLVRDLVATDSVNHNFRENRGGESAVCDLVEFYLQKQGIPYEAQSVRDRQRNIIARIEGEKTDRSLCFEAHLDTTTARGMSIHPFGAEEIDGNMHGRGTCDAKAAMGAMLAALGALQASGTPPPQTIVLAATVDKEVGLTGIKRFLGADALPTAAVVGAPTNLAVARACRGCFRWRISVGENPQSYAPATRNSIIDAVALVARIEDRVGQLAASNPHPLLGETEIRPSRIRANSQEGFLPPYCTIDFECYTVPTYPADSVLETIDDLIGAFVADDPELKIAVEPPSLNDPPTDLAAESPLVRGAMDACRQVLGAAQEIGFLDSGHTNCFAAAGVDAIALGPGDPKLIRAANEHVPIEQLASAAAIYLALMRSPLD